MSSPSPTTGAPARSAPPAQPPPPGPTPPELAADEPRVRRSMAAAIIAAAVVLGVVVVGAAVRLDPDSLPTGPPLAPPSPTPVGLQYDSTTRQASYENVTVTLADAPYHCASKPEPADPFSDALPCSYVVHRSYSETSSWVANTGLALIPPALARPGDPQGSARTIFEHSLKAMYPADARVSKLTVEPYAGQDDTAVLSARVNVSMPKLPTTYDAVVIVVLTAKDGQQVAFYSFKPNDAGDQTLSVLQESAKTLARTG